MLRLSISKDALDFVLSLQGKQFKQVVGKVFGLLSDPLPNDSSQLKGYDYRRVDVGEYRIIYRTEEQVVVVHVVGKRNDDEVYKQLARKPGS
jgi:mRNA interferase RelE/StbE